LVRTTPVLQRNKSVLDLESELTSLPSYRSKDMDLLGCFLYIPDETDELAKNNEK
ncbi:7756_t:CDS:1, partial [Gigaspora margarita]